ncbi:CHAT domain-containing protein [Cellulomonas sp. ATA003]|uniref:CHAT domain-containing protein n=1 Tax=Cellulomonas sp. ATA003 TaxID=3073064 RepID=UPI0028731F56|nr:CHAT domain-containing protein [Cellulomonas sp. ATA003]WNB87285.1 CHAT domain-containing protein [Cellulomonas sp. ATA003]
MTALTKVADGGMTLDAPQLVVLHLVEADPFDYAATFGGHARELVRRGVQAVLAMQYALPPAEARDFTQTLYEAIADGAPVDAAVREARRHLPDEDDPLFGAPVLYLQSRDGRLVEGGLPTQEPARPRTSKDDHRAPSRARTERLRRIAQDHAPTAAAFELIAGWLDTIRWDELDLETARSRIRTQLRADVDQHGNAYIEMLTELRGETRGA